MTMLRFAGGGDIKIDVARHLAQRHDLRGRRIVDLPAGRGDASRILHRRGAEVLPFDLFPESFEYNELECKPADLRHELPLDSSQADMVLFQEAVEHLPDPLFALRELNRILRTDGTLLLTTPNVSHLRARLSRLLVESDLYNRLPPSEFEALWHTDGGRPYFGHLFLIGVQRLLTLARLAGFRLVQVLPVKFSATSLLLSPLYPCLATTTAFALWRSRKRSAQTRDPRLEQAQREQARLNLHPTVLFGKHLFLEWRKARDWDPEAWVVHKDPATIR